MNIEKRNPILPPVEDPEVERQQIVVVNDLTLANFFGDVGVTVRFWRRSLQSHFSVREQARTHRIAKIRKLIHDLSNIQARCASEADFYFFFQWADEAGQQVTWAHCGYQYTDQGKRIKAIVDLGECVHASFRREARL